MFRQSICFFMAIAALALGACSHEGREAGRVRSISLATSVARPDMRIAEGGFSEGDVIGLYVVPYSGDNSTPGSITDSDYALNEQYVYNGSSWSLPGGGMIPWPGVRNIDIYAYSPYDAALDGADPAAYRFRVRTDQSERSGYDASDLLWSRRLGVAPVDNIPLLFHHRMSKINVNVRSDVASVEITGVKLHSIVPECIVNLQEGNSVVSASTPVTIVPYTLPAVGEGYDLSLTAVVPPQGIVSGTGLIEITTPDGINYLYHTSDNLSLGQGKSITFNITVHQQGISVSVGSIQEWDDTLVIDGGIGDPAMRVVDLSAIDWSESYVHYIYDRNVLIGQICREYLFRIRTGIDFPAIVVYPLGTDGRMDITKGFVPRVYNRQPNTSTRTYELNPANVHGGRVEFGPQDTLYSYAAGSMPLISKVRIVSGDDISAAADNSIATLTTRPYTVTDVDGNVYPVVKIGTQYWIRENYRVEHYRDGSPMTFYYYNDDRQTYRMTFGGLYTWYTIMDPAGFAPEGWRVPTRNDWYSAHYYLNPEAGRKLKANTTWYNLDYGDDVTGFSALPGGRRTDAGVYNESISYGQWWSATQSSATVAYRIYMGATMTNVVDATLAKNYTQSVRLLRED